MSSLCIKLHKSHRLALPAAKQKEEDEIETSEPCGLKLLMGARCLGAVGHFVKLNHYSAFKSSLKLGKPLKCMDKEHSKN